MILNTNKVTFQDIIGEAEIFKQQINIAKRAAAIDAPVLITGETGTGKEMFAKAIHCQSARSKEPYIAENCAAIPFTLAEGILFGTQKGAFTQAISREGLFEYANGGTLLLDELNSMPVLMQAKILRCLQEHTVRRVGGSKDIPFDVRIMATVNENINELLSGGRLRMDLYYRINVIRINIPPLRSHKEDIPLYVEHFLDEANKTYNKYISGFSFNAMRELNNKDYPGNIRELHNLVMGAVAMSSGVDIIRTKDLI
ncbi:MAG: sigma 54-interacting transcriptional regulator [Anaerovoracaceae bacterium]